MVKSADYVLKMQNVATLFWKYVHVLCPESFPEASSLTSQVWIRLVARFCERTHPGLSSSFTICLSCSTFDNHVCRSLILQYYFTLFSLCYRLNADVRITPYLVFVVYNNCFSRKTFCE